MKEIPIYCIETEEVDTYDLTGKKPEETMTRMAIDLSKVEAFFEDEDNTVIFIGGNEIKTSLSYSEFIKLFKKSGFMTSKDLNA